MKQLTFERFIFLPLAFSLLFLGCNRSASSGKSSVSPVSSMPPGPYILKSPTQLLCIEFNSDGTFKQYVTYLMTSKAVAFDGKWSRDGSTISLKPFFHTIDWETGADLSSPEEFYESQLKLKGEAIIVNEQSKYIFKLLK